MTPDDLTGTALAMYNLIALGTDPSDPSNPPALTTRAIAEALEVDRGTIAHHGRQLVEAGLLASGALYHHVRGRPPRCYWLAGSPGPADVIVEPRPTRRRARMTESKPPLPAPRITEEILALLRSGPQTVTHLSDAVRVSRRTITANLTPLLADGTLETFKDATRRGRPRIYYRLA